MFNHLDSVDMVKSENTNPPAAHDDIVKSELMEILQAVISGGGGLSAIHHILDEAKTMSEIRTRFAQWQADRRTDSLEQTSSAPHAERTAPEDPSNPHDS